MIACRAVVARAAVRAAPLGLLAVFVAHDLGPTALGVGALVAGAIAGATFAERAGAVLGGSAGWSFWRTGASVGFLCLVVHAVAIVNLAWCVAPSLDVGARFSTTATSMREHGVELLELAWVMALPSILQSIAEQARGPDVGPLRGPMLPIEAIVLGAVWATIAGAAVFFSPERPPADYSVGEWIGLSCLVTVSGVAAASVLLLLDGVAWRLAPATTDAR